MQIPWKDCQWKECKQSGLPWPPTPWFDCRCQDLRPPPSRPTPTIMHTTTPTSIYTGKIMCHHRRHSHRFTHWFPNSIILCHPFSQVRGDNLYFLNFRHVIFSNYCNFMFFQIFSKMTKWQGEWYTKYTLNASLTNKSTCKGLQMNVYFVQSMNEAC